MTDNECFERDLAKRAREGDDLAFEELVRIHQDRLYRYLWRLTGNGEDAVELTQSSFVRAYTSIRRFRGESSFRTYLYRIATNAWRNTVRDRSRRPTVDVDTVPLSSPGNPADRFEEELRLRKLWELAARLPARQKEALILRTREGYPFEEVARIMGCTVGSAKASYHHAVRKLRTAFEEEER